MDRIQASQVPRLDTCDRATLMAYFENAWQLEDLLMKSLASDASYYSRPDPLRNPLIFYLGHTAAFFVNKLILVRLVDQPVRADYEQLFGVGVDPKSSQDLDAAIRAISWPDVKDVWEYRDQVYAVIRHVIETINIDLPIHPDQPIWAVLMGIEHSRVHFETSSMLLRQMPLDELNRPQGWQYASNHQEAPANVLIEIPGGNVELGKPVTDQTYGWDMEYGHRSVEVKPFCVSRYPITHQEFLEFVEADGYNTPDYWDPEAWTWKLQHYVQHPKFWISGAKGYRYRAMFDEIDLPLAWPVEVNYYEARAYCRWKGSSNRLITEAEWTCLTDPVSDPEAPSSLPSQSLSQADPLGLATYNLNLQWGSPSPVGAQVEPSSFGVSDLRGNVWEWSSDDFQPLSGFKSHILYPDHAAPYFDQAHKIMLGGSWASNGTMASRTYRNWFRPYFYQHAGFRLVQDQAAHV